MRRTRETFLVTSGTGYKDGPFNPKSDHIGYASFITDFSDGTLTLKIGRFKEAEVSRSGTERIANGVEAAPGIQPPQDFLLSYPNLHIEDWGQRSESLSIY